MSMRNGTTFLLVLCGCFVVSDVPAQSFKKLIAPKREATGGYHGRIYVFDAEFINQDQHVVVAINESITVYETSTGKRLHTLLNKNPETGRLGSVRSLHVVDDGKTILCNQGITWVGPDDPRADSGHWIRWDVAEITSEGVPPIARPLLSRQGLNRGEYGRYEKGLRFVKQHGPDYVFLLDERSKNPTTIRTYRPGDRIDRPREELRFEPADDVKSSYIFQLGTKGRIFVCGAGTPDWNGHHKSLAECQRVTLSRGGNGNLSWTTQPIEVAEQPIGEPLQTIVRYPNGSVHSGGFHAHRDWFVPKSIGEKIVSTRGLPSNDGRFIALSGHAKVWFQVASYRSVDSVAVTIVDREMGKQVHQLPCGKGFAARPLAFSSDGTMLITVHDLQRPGLRIWKLPGYPKKDALQFPSITNTPSDPEKESE